MDTTEAIDVVVMQAWKSDGIEATRRKVEERLVDERRRRIEHYRAEGRKAYAWACMAS